MRDCVILFKEVMKLFLSGGERRLYLALFQVSVKILWVGLLIELLEEYKHVMLQEVVLSQADHNYLKDSS